MDINNLILKIEESVTQDVTETHLKTYSNIEIFKDSEQFDQSKKINKNIAKKLKNCNMLDDPEKAIVIDDIRQYSKYDLEELNLEGKNSAEMSISEDEGGSVGSGDSAGSVGSGDMSVSDTAVSDIIADGSISTISSDVTDIDSHGTTTRNIATVDNIIGMFKRKQHDYGGF